LAHISACKDGQNVVGHAGQVSSATEEPALTSRSFVQNRVLVRGAGNLQPRGAAQSFKAKAFHAPPDKQNEDLKNKNKNLPRKAKEENLSMLSYSPLPNEDESKENDENINKMGKIIEKENMVKSEENMDDKSDVEEASEEEDTVEAASREEIAAEPSALAAVGGHDMLFRGQDLQEKNGLKKKKKKKGAMKVDEESFGVGVWFTNGKLLEDEEDEVKKSTTPTQKEQDSSEEKKKNRHKTNEKVRKIFYS
jgi:hypothetical protein